MKLKAQLIQPGITKAPFAECEIEVDDDASDEKIRIISAHKLMENFDIVFERIK